MARRQIPTPMAIGIVLVALLIAVAFLWRQSSPPAESRLESWAPYPQIPSAQQPQGVPSGR